MDLSEPEELSSPQATSSRKGEPLEFPQYTSLPREFAEQACCATCPSASRLRRAPTGLVQCDERALLAFGAYRTEASLPRRTERFPPPAPNQAPTRTGTAPGDVNEHGFLAKWSRECRK